MMAWSIQEHCSGKLEFRLCSMNKDETKDFPGKSIHFYFFTIYVYPRIQLLLASGSEQRLKENLSVECGDFVRKRGKTEC